ncbi:MAG: moderate conductance mechanosensitive channel [Solirubrobacteraceae bacterium]|nr:moderate conductance mechanosensitive channel [Solirubrobacteraceae bacterium]
MIAITPLTDFSLWLRSNALEMVLFVLGAVLLSRFAVWIRDQATTRIEATADPDVIVRSETSKHQRALAEILTWAFTVLLWIVTVVLVINRFGVPFATLVAPLTAGGVALGLGAQQLVRDLIGGLFIVAERQYGYGDLITVAGTADTDGATGTVEEITLRITRLRTANGELVVIPNGRVTQVTNLSSEWARAVVDIPLPVGQDVVQANETLRTVGEEAYEDDVLRALLLDKPVVMGVESIEVGQVNLRMVARTQPGRQFQVERALRERIAEAFQRPAGDV